MSVPDRVARRWRSPTCGPACQRFHVFVLGRRNSEWIEAHDPLTHEMAGRHDGVELFPEIPAMVRTGGLEIDYRAKAIRVHGETVAMPPLQWRAIAYLGQRLGETCSHAEIVCAVWGPEEVPVARVTAGRRSAWHALRVHLVRVRQRLGACESLLETQQNVGYRLLAREVAP